MSVQATIEKQEPNTIKIHLHIPSEQAQQEYNKACRRLSQRVNIPGFRRGKAPRNVIEKNIGVDRIKQEALDRILPTLFADTISEHQLDVVAPPQIQSYKFDLDSGIDINAHAELRPEVTLPEVASLKPQYAPFTHDADAMDKEMQALCTRFTTLEPVIDRPSEATDTIQFDFEGSIDGNLIRGGAAKNYRMDLTNQNFIEGFADQLVGHAIGEAFEVKVSFPEDYHDKDLAGKPAVFQCKINEIYKKTVPTINDELAKQVGDFESLDALKAHIETALAESAERETQFRKQKALVQALVGASQVDVPESMIVREARILLDDVKNKLREQGLTWDKFVEAQTREMTDGMDNPLSKREVEERVMGNIRLDAIQRIKTSLVFGAFAKQENLSVTDEEFTQHVFDLAEMSQTDEKMVMRNLANNPGAVQAFTDQILSQKVMEMLIDKVAFEVVAETPTAQLPDAKGATEAITQEPVDVVDTTD